MFTPPLIDAVNKCMAEKRLNRNHVAELSNVPIGTLNRIMSGNSGDIYATTYLSLAKGLNISVDRIIGVEPETIVPTSCADCPGNKEFHKSQEEIASLIRDKENMRSNNLKLLEKYEESLCQQKETRKDYEEEKKTLKKERIFSRILLLAIIVFLIIEILFPDFGWIQY